MGLYQLSDRKVLAQFPAVDACYSWTWDDFHMSFHSHARGEVMYLLRGKCRIQILEDGIEHEFQLNVGEFVFIDAGVVHALQVDTSCYMVNVEFSISGDPAMLSLQKLMDASAVFHAWMHTKELYQFGKDPDGSLYTALSAVVDDFSNRETTDPAMRDLKMGQMLIQLANTLTATGKRSKCLVHVRRCVQLLSERMSEEVRIADLAADIGVSSAYLQRIFHQVHGVTIVDYLNKMRIERAKLLLSNTEDSVIDIAFASGFNSRQHFSRVFTVIEGCSPQSYRRMQTATESKQLFFST